VGISSLFIPVRRLYKISSSYLQSGRYRVIWLSVAGDATTAAPFAPLRPAHAPIPQDIPHIEHSATTADAIVAGERALKGRLYVKKNR
jgi:hypothetical protein